MCKEGGVVGLLVVGSGGGMARHADKVVGSGGRG